MEARLLVSDFLGKFGVFWYQLAADIEVFQLHLVTATYEEGAGAAEKLEFWTVVLTMIQVIRKDQRKVRVDADTAYGLDNPADMVGQYLWGTLKANEVMDDFLRTHSTRILRWLHISRHTFSNKFLLKLKCRI